MAKNNPGDILTGDWNPVVGCSRYSPGCRDCWWLDGIMPWQKRLRNLPATMKDNQSVVLDQRFDPKKLSPKKGIVGVVQHGDLFWDKIPDEVIDRVLDLVDQVAAKRIRKNERLVAAGKPADMTKYVLWTKRAERMAKYMKRRYPKGVPDYIACGVSIEDQKLANKRLPHLLKVKGHRFVMIEPMLGPVDLTGFEEVSWIVCGSETGSGTPRPMDPDWARAVRDFAVRNRIPFFVKQLGTSHKKPDRILDGRTWDQFPPGFIK